ncbi:MAG: hypothetical protein IPP72_00325 [Chitinophagaceae bacterium]|nr:hypothetical protein [Chitinophagaceae bacterium]
MYPASNSNCTYAGNIVILPSSDSVVFAALANGRVTIDGNSNSFFNNNSVKGTSIKRITINKTAGAFTLYKPLYVPAGGDLVLTAGKMVTAASALLVLMDESCTVTSTTAASTSYIDGPMRYDVSSTALQTLHFPIGKYNDCRPAELRVKHTTGNSYSYTAEMTSTSANALGWSYPASVYTVSKFRWWDISRTITSSGTSAPTAELDLSSLPQVTLFYSYNDQVTNPVNLTICKNTYNAATSWVDIGSTGATVNTGKVTSTSSPTGFNSFSRFTLGYYGIPPAPTANDSSRCGTGTVTISAAPVSGEAIDWYANPTGGIAIGTGSNTFTTPSIAATTTYYAEARNTRGYVSATRTAVKAIVYNTAIISSFSPSSGENGTTVIITGNYFTNVSAVSFGGTAAASYVVNSATQITAVAGTGTTGVVAVTNNCGTGTKTGFTYLPITIWTGAVNSSWNVAGNWDDGVPTNMHCAIIPNVATLPLISSDQSVKSLTLQTGAAVDIAVGNNLSIRDSIANNGAITGGGSILLNGTTSQVISGAGNYNNLVLNNSNGAVIKSGAGNSVLVTGSYTPTAGVLTTNDNLALKSSAAATGIIATGAAGGGYINGKVTLERFIPSKRAWRMINFPITSISAPTINTSLQEAAGGNAALNPNPGYGTHITGGSMAGGFDQNSNNNASMKEWVSGEWQGIASTNTAIGNQLPYFLFVRGSRANNLSLGASAPADNTVLRLTADVKQGNQSINISGSGWQLTGNPFPSIINLDAVAINNSSVINRNFKYWDPKLGGSNNVGGYVTASYNGFDYDYSPTPVSQLSEYAQPFSGFFVDATGSGNITVTEASKCNCGNGNVFRPAPPGNTTSKLHINLRSYNSDGTLTVVDGAMTAFNDKYSNSLDSYDATKLFNSGGENLSINSNHTKISIERRSAVTVSDTIYLDISNMRLRNYQFEIKPENFDAAVTTAYLEDSYTNEKKPISLSATSTIDFGIINDPAAYASSRFRIVLEKDNLAQQSKTGIVSTTLTSEAKSIKLLQNPVTNNTVVLMMTKQQKGNYSITVTNNEGKEIGIKQFYHDGTDGARTIPIKKYLPGEILIATIKSPTGSITSFNILIQ